ncbi:MAG: hypothetical protein ACLRPC_04775 [Streptococcus sp.]
MGASRTNRSTTLLAKLVKSVQEPFGVPGGGRLSKNTFGVQDGQTAYEPFGAPGAQGFQQSSPVEGPQAGGHVKQFSQETKRLR